MSNPTELHEAGPRPSVDGKSVYRCPSAMERYLSEHDPWKRFLVTAKGNERNYVKAGIQAFTKDVDKFIKMIEDHGRSEHHSQSEHHDKVKLS